MAFAINPSRFYSLSSYSQCEQHYNSFTYNPIYDTAGVNLVKGSNSKADRDRYGVMKLNDDAYALRYHNTHVVVFHKDGVVDVDLSYRSRSTRAFADKFIWPLGVRIDSDDLIFMSRVGPQTQKLCEADDEASTPYGGYYFMVYGKFSFHAPTFEMMTVVHATITRLNKSKAHEARQRARPLIESANIYNGLELHLDSAHVPSRGVYEYCAKEVYDDPDNDEPYFRYMTKFCVRVPEDNKYRLDFHAFKHKTYAAFYKFADAYDVIPVPIGAKPPRDVTVQRVDHYDLNGELQ